MSKEELESRYIKLHNEIKSKEQELFKLEKQIRILYNNGIKFKRIECFKQCFYYFNIEQLMPNIQEIYPKTKFYKKELDKKAVKKYISKNKNKYSFLYNKKLKQYLEIRKFLCVSDKEVLDSITTKRENSFKIKIKDNQ